jgi:hypothetical protein
LLLAEIGVDERGEIVVDGDRLHGVGDAFSFGLGAVPLRTRTRRQRAFAAASRSSS